MSCPAFSDRSFGPRVHSECRSFDFTLQFEDILFACLPSAMLILLAPSKVALLLRRPATFSIRSKLLASKTVTLAALLAFQLAYLALRTRTPSFQTCASVAADVLTFVATLVVLLLSVLGHQRSHRPSTLLSLYLSAAVLLGIARVRTTWLLASGGPLPAIITTLFILTVVVFVQESVQVKKRPRLSGTLNAQNKSMEERSGFWARTCFVWLAQTFHRGHSKIISLNDLPRLDSRLESRSLHKRLAVAWDACKYFKPRQSMLLELPFTLPVPVIPRLCLTIFTFTQPFLINTTVIFVSTENPDANYGRGIIAAWAFVYLGIAISNSVYQYYNLRFTTRLRGGLIALIYQQAVRAREVDIGDITAVSLMGTDVERIVGAMSMFHAVWASLIDIAVASWLLGMQLSLACLAPVVLVLAFIAAGSKISVATKIAQKHWIERIQERLRVTTTMLDDMKAVRMLGLTDFMSSIIQQLREDEINTSKSFRRLLVATLLLCGFYVSSAYDRQHMTDPDHAALTPINLAPIFTFAVYVIIAVFWKSETLLPAQAFTSIALIGLLTTPVIMFIQLLPMVVQSFACFDRIQTYCNYNHQSASPNGGGTSCTSQSGTNVSLGPLTSDGADKPTDIPQTHAVSFKANSFGWTKDQTVLHDLTVDIPRNGVTIVVGSVGSGKSSFLSAILGDLIATSLKVGRASEMHIETGQVAYCSQIPWLEKGTIRQNILGITPYEQKWYGSVTSACGLEADLQTLQEGDSTLVGSKGINLSGGQKQRIALARAVYSRQQVVVLDDVFSGMDAHTANNVSTDLLGPGGILRRQRTTVIIATHSHKIMPFADNIISLEDGRIQETGSFDSLIQGQGYMGRLGLQLSRDGGVVKVQESNNSTSSVKPSIKSVEHQEEEKPHTDMTDTRRKNGDMSVYKYYLKNAGWKVVILYTISVVIWIFFSEFSSKCQFTERNYTTTTKCHELKICRLAIWVKRWSEANTNEANKSVGFYIGIYAMMGVLGTLGASLAAWFAVLDMITNTALNLHWDLLKTTLAASFRFLAKTANGDILNRFSEDMQLIDMDLPTTMVNYTSTGVSVLAKILILAVFSQYLGISIPFFLTVLYFLQSFYLQTSRQIRLLGIEAKAPLYTHFSESVAGSATIRAFGWETKYQERNYYHIDMSQRPDYVQSCIQACLSFVLDLVVAVLAVILVCIVVTWHNKFSAGSVGVSLTMIIGFNEVLARLIQNWTKLESSVGAVARVKRFMAETETEQTAGRRPLPRDWPRAGALSFSGVVASYGPEADPVLKGLSLSVEAGQHVAICGRTGSGKTSLILSLLQMIDIRKGSIELDGVDISSLQQNELRSCVNVIPQDPFLMPGTIRRNIDPLDAVSDEAKITRSLDRVGLSKLVQEQGGLDKEIDVKSWSAGQQQLLCIARAMLKECKLLVLDEAMSSMDSGTESVMQEVIDTDFRECTVLAITHRLRYISHYDVVGLLSEGKLVEIGEPATLMAGETRFAELYRMKAN
ncbi:hypothetical protein PG989_005850 [Apiospora arundinis]